MVSVVEAEASHGLDVLGCQRGQQQADVGDVVRHVMSTKDVAGNDSGLPRLGDVTDAAGKDGIAVVCLAVAGEEANESLERASVGGDVWSGLGSTGLTEKDAIIAVISVPKCNIKHGLQLIQMVENYDD